MLITEIFGPNLLPMMEYIKNLENQHASITQDAGGNLLVSLGFPELVQVYSIRDFKWILTEHAHTFLSQPMEEGDFVRGEEPTQDEMAIPDGHGGVDFDLTKLREWKNHFPLFKGEWEIRAVSRYGKDQRGVFYQGDLIGFLGDFKTRNDFATHCFNQGIPLELNEEYQIQ